MAESEQKLKSLLMKVKEESEKPGLKLNILWTLWERERVGRFGRMALKHVKYDV